MLTIDASNQEAMQALASSLKSLRSVGTVVTRIVDSVDTLVGGEASATLEIVNATMANENLLILTIDMRFPLVDYFYLYMHLGSSTPPCPPFDPANRCCHGDMTNTAEFVTAGNEYVDCTSGNPFPALDRFVSMWDGAYLSEDKQSIRLSINLPTTVPSTIESGARVYRLGIGMVTFGTLAQNTEARVELVLNTSYVSTSFGAFQYSNVEYSRLQMEGCAGQVFAHLVVKAPGVESVQNIRYQTWDAGDWLTPNCSSPRLCNVSIDSGFVDVYVYMPKFNFTTTLYVLLQRGNVLTRVVAKTDNTIVQHCNAPMVIDATDHNAFTIQVTQGNKLVYSGPIQLVQLADVAALNIRIVSQSALYKYKFDNISVIYSLVDSAQILALMPNGQITPALETLCDSGNVCLIEDLMRNGVCQTGEKCEIQGESLFLMPLYPWGSATLKAGTYTAMVAEIREVFVQGSNNNTTLMRRLMQWFVQP